MLEAPVLVAVSLLHVAVQRLGMNTRLVEIVTDITHPLFGIAKHHGSRGLEMGQKFYQRCEPIIFLTDEEALGNMLLAVLRLDTDALRCILKSAA